MIIDTRTRLFLLYFGTDCPHNNQGQQTKVDNAGHQTREISASVDNHNNILHKTRSIINAQIISVAKDNLCKVNPQQNT